MNPFGLPEMPPDKIVTHRVNSELLPALRTVVSLFAQMGDEFSANDVMAAVAAAEAAAAEGETPTYGGFDTDVIRTWYTLFGALNTFLSANFTVTRRDGTTASISPKTAVRRYYAPVQG